MTKHTPDHIADATKMVQPAPALPGDDGEICARLLSACTGHPHALIPWPHRLLHDAVSHISDLTRRLAEVEAHADGFEQMQADDAACAARYLNECIALRARLAEAEKSAWEECHAMSSRLSKANQESNMWRNCAVYLDYRGADYCVAIHKELDGLQEDNRKHREQVSKLLAEWKRRAETAEARVRELVAEAAKRPLASDDEQTIADLEAFKARVMEWARGRCCTCRWDCAHPQPGKPSCNVCSNGDKGDWTPAWEVGE